MENVLEEELESSNCFLPKVVLILNLAFDRLPISIFPPFPESIRNEAFENDLYKER